MRLVPLSGVPVAGELAFVPPGFAEVFASFRAPVYGYLCRCGLDASTRDDLAQEIFLKVHRALPSYRPLRPLRAWIFTIVANTVRSHLRRRRDRPTESAAEPAVAAEAFGAVAGHELATLLERAVGDLPEHEREVVILCCIEALPQDEVAQILELPVNTVKTHLRRARLRLAAVLARVERQEERKLR